MIGTTQPGRTSGLLLPKRTLRKGIGKRRPMLYDRIRWISCGLQTWRHDYVLTWWRHLLAHIFNGRRIVDAGDLVNISIQWALFNTTAVCSVVIQLHKYTGQYCLLLVYKLPLTEFFTEVSVYHFFIKLSDCSKSALAKAGPAGPVPLPLY